MPEDDDQPASFDDACRSVLRDDEFWAAHDDGIAPLDILNEVNQRWPGAWPLCTVIDAADAGDAYLGPRL